MGDDHRPRTAWADVARYSDLGLRFVVAAVVFAGCGYAIDRKFEPFGRFPLLTLVGLLFGLAVGMYSLFRSLKPKGVEAPSDDGPAESGRGVDRK